MQRVRDGRWRWAAGLLLVALLTQCKASKHEVDVFVEKRLRTTAEWTQDAKELDQRRETMAQRLVAAEPNARKANLAALDDRITLINKNLGVAAESVAKVRKEAEALNSALKALTDKSPARSELEKLDATIKPAGERVAAALAAGTKALDAAEEKLTGLERAIINVAKGLEENGVDHDAE